MKLVKHYLESIDGVAIYPIISLIIFLGFFTMITIWALRLRKPEIAKMKNMVFDKNELEQQDNPLLNQLK